MVALLDFPRETIQEIIEYILLPPYLHYADQRNFNENEWIASGSPRRSSRNRSDDLRGVLMYFRRKPLYSLRLACKQLKQEVDDVWRRKGEDAPCELDIRVTKDGDVLVEWLSIPQTMFNHAGGGWKLENMGIRMRFVGSYWFNQPENGTGLQDHSRSKNILNDSVRIAKFQDLVQQLIEDTMNLGPSPRPAPKPSKRVTSRTINLNGHPVRKAAGGTFQIRRINCVDAVKITLDTTVSEWTSVRSRQFTMLEMTAKAIVGRYRHRGLSFETWEASEDTLREVWADPEMPYVERWQFYLGEFLALGCMVDRDWDNAGAGMRMISTLFGHPLNAVED